MLLAIDIGNSDTVFGINDGGKWVHIFRIESSFSKVSTDFDARLRLMFLEHNLKISDIKNNTGCKSREFLLILAIIKLKVIRHD